jgi:hypothetical protein
VWRGAHAVVTITEIMYHPRSSGNDLEYIELHNETPDPIDITGYYFSAGVRFTFAERTFLDPGAHLVVCANVEVIRSTYGIDNVVGNWDPSTALNNGGEAIELSNSAGVVEARVTYNDRGKWPAGADGAGHSLALQYVYSEMDDPDSWALSAALGGSPGLPNPTATDAPSVFINEGFVLGPPGENWIEIYNAGGTEVNLGGYHLTTARDDLLQTTIPDNTLLSPRSWLVLSDSTLGLDLAPDSTGRTFVALTTQAGNRVVDAHTFKPRLELPGASEARMPDGAAKFSDAADLTPGTANKVTVITDVVIHEILYHPLDDNPAGEFLELYNRGTEPVDLTGWKLSDGVRFDLPDGTILQPKAFLVIARNPDEIQAVYGLSDALVIGPQEPDHFGVLSDKGERVTLEDDRGNIADTIRYHDGGEWPRWADGGGSSMELVDAFQDNGVGQAWDSSDDSAKAPVKRYSYKGHRSSGEGEFHLVLGGAGIVVVDDLRMTALKSELIPSTVYIEFDDSWTYFKGITEPPAGWMEKDFDASGWLEGPAPIGYGRQDIVTDLVDMRGTYVSFYLRKTFELTETTASDSLILEVDFDDGFVAYFNGTEVASRNMTQDRSHDALPIASRSIDDPFDLIDLTAQQELLVPGENVVAVQVHNFTLLNSDAKWHGRLLRGSLQDGPDLFTDGTFESENYGASWTIEGTHERSGRTTGVPLSGSGSLKIVATGQGDNKVNRIETSDSGITKPQAKRTHDISFLAKWLVGSPILLTHGDHASGAAPSYARSHRLETPPDLGTPGTVNSVTLKRIALTGSENLGPLISRVRQTPALPLPGQTVEVEARISDSDGVAAATLYYTLNTPRPAGDPATVAIPMVDPDGNGAFVAHVPGQEAGATVVCHIVAGDSLGREGRYPLDHLSRTHPLVLDPSRASSHDEHYVVYRHDVPVKPSVQSYRFWMHEANEAYLSSRPLHSNAKVQGSFVFQNRDIYYNSNARFSGSPFSRVGWGGSYRVRLPKDNPLHGSIESFNLEDHANDGRERISNYLIRYNQGQSRVPYSLQWRVRFQVNDRLDALREHVETPNNQFIQRWYPGDDDGDFFEMNIRHSFNDAGESQDNSDARLLYPPYGSTSARGADKEEYRYHFNLRNNESDDDYSELIRLAQLMTPRETSDEKFDELVEDYVNVEEFCRVWAIRMNTDDWDQWGASRGKNCYLYRPRGDGRWVLIPWDMELTYEEADRFLPPPHAVDATPFYGAGQFTETQRFWNRPRIKRIFYGVLKEMIDHQFRSDFLLPYMQKLDAIGVQRTEVGKPGGFIDQRRERLEKAVNGVSSAAIDFVVTTGGGGPIELEHLAELKVEGSAPVEISEIVGGFQDATGFTPLPLQTEFSRSDLLGWTATGELPLGSHSIVFLGFDSRGNLVDTTALEVTVVSSPRRFIRGDANLDTELHLDDAISMLGFLFKGTTSPTCLDAIDANDDGALDVTDPIYLIGYLFVPGKPSPPPPFPETGVDPTPDTIGCANTE